MADYLTLQLAAETPYVVPVRTGSGSREANEVSGETVRMFDSSLASSEISGQAKPTWKFATAPMKATEYAAVLGYLEQRAIKAGGYAIVRTPGAMVDVWATVENVQHDADGDADILYAISFTIQQR